eukprot:GDKJ01025481.1.p1 GENE.GDKJ01025481.1~~GDKJ01025481.1.p1  ORF type:complete len:830 (-),score=266.57 GDKJ01025481.1:1572-3893(-)
MERDNLEKSSGNEDLITDGDLETRDIPVVKEIENEEEPDITGLRPNKSGDLGDVSKAWDDYWSGRRARQQRLWNAAESGDVETLDEILQTRDAIGDLNSCGLYDWTALHFAAHAGSAECCALLLSKGASVSSLSSTGASSLHLAAKMGKVSVVCMLIQHKALVNAQDFFGNTPLHEATHNGQELCVRALIALGGASVRIRNNLGQTAAANCLDRVTSDAIREEVRRRVLLRKRKRLGNGDMIDESFAAPRSLHDVDMVPPPPVYGSTVFAFSTSVANQQNNDDEALCTDDKTPPSQRRENNSSEQNKNDSSEQLKHGLPEEESLSRILADLEDLESGEVEREYTRTRFHNILIHNSRQDAVRKLLHQTSATCSRHASITTTANTSSASQCNNNNNINNNKYSVDQTSTSNVKNTCDSNSNNNNCATSQSPSSQFDSNNNHHEAKDTSDASPSHNNNNNNIQNNNTTCNNNNNSGSKRLTPLPRRLQTASHQQQPSTHMSTHSNQHSNNNNNNMNVALNVAFHHPTTTTSGGYSQVGSSLGPSSLNAYQHPFECLASPYFHYMESSNVVEHSSLFNNANSPPHLLANGYNHRVGAAAGASPTSVAAAVLPGSSSLQQQGRDSTLSSTPLSNASVSPSSLFIAAADEDDCNNLPVAKTEGETAGAVTSVCIRGGAALSATATRLTSLLNTCPINKAAAGSIEESTTTTAQLSSTNSSHNSSSSSAFSSALNNHNGNLSVPTGGKEVDFVRLGTSSGLGDSQFFGDIERLLDTLDA